MLAASDLVVALSPKEHEVQPETLGRALIPRWHEARFEREKCRDILVEVLREHESVAEMFVPDAILDGERPASDAYLKRSAAVDGDWRFSIRSRKRNALLSLDLEADALESMALVIYDLVHSDSAQTFSDEWGPEAKALLRFIDEADAGLENGQWHHPVEPGLYRREHANLVISSGATTLAMDPQRLQDDWTTNNARYPAEREPLAIDAVFLTHTHEDHYHLPSLIASATADDTRFFIPPCTPTNLLCPQDVPEVCRLVGLDVVDAAWWSRHEVGDIAVQVLPFYGEQPTRFEPAVPPFVRNWGSVYRFDLPQGYSVAALVDSGSDPRGDALEALARSVQERGPIDVLTSCTLEFGEGINAGLPHYLLTLPFARLEQIAGAAQHSMTFGPEGIARACRAAQASYFLPYAMGFEGIGRRRDSEVKSVAAVRRWCDKLDVRTRIVDWAPGDGAFWRDGELEVRRGLSTAAA